MLGALWEKAARYGAPNVFDKLKAIAIVTMTIDHIGFCLAPENDWLRSIGRVSMPLWLFVVGYHVANEKSNGKWHRKETALLAAAFFLMLLNIGMGRALFPLTIPIAILLSRRLLLWERFQKLALEQPLGAFAVISVLIFPSIFLIEYGSLSIYFAVLGWYVARGVDSSAVRMFAIASAVVYSVVENMIFSFGPLHEWIVYFGVALVTLLPLETRPGTWHWMAARPKTARIALFLTRNSLLYYVAHLTVLKIAGYMLYHADKAWKFSLF